MGIGVAPLGVPFDDFEQRFLRAVVHVGSTLRDIADGRRFESAAIFIVVGFRKTTEVGLLGVHADAQVVVFFVCEVGAEVAGSAGPTCR